MPVIPTSNPINFNVYGRPKENNAVGAIRWGYNILTANNPVITWPAPTAYIDLQAAQNKSILVIRGIGIDNSLCRVPVKAQSLDTNWSVICDAGEVIVAPMFSNSPAVLFQAPLGSMDGDITRYVLTDYDMPPMRYSVGQVSLSPLANAADVGLGGWIGLSVNIANGSNNIGNAANVVFANMTIDVIGVTCTSAASATFTLEDRTSSNTQWAYNLSLPANGNLPFARLLDLKPPGQKIFGPGGLKLFISEVNITGGIVQINGAPQ